MTAHGRGGRDDEELKRYLARVMVRPLEHVGIRLREYDPAWAERFRREATTIREVLDGRELRIEHIGVHCRPLARSPSPSSTSCW